jgi:DNA-binding CsgD family transcriptional regulator
MIGIAHFLLLLTLGVGQVAIYISYQSYKRNKSAHLFSYFLVLVGFNVITLAHTIESFLKATLPDIYQSDSGLERFDWTYILLSVIRILILYFMARFLAGLFQKPWHKRAFTVTLMIIAGFLVLQMLAFTRFGRELEIPRYSAMVVHFVFFTVFCVLLIQGLHFARDIRNRSRKRALTSFIGFLLLFNCLLFINRIGGYSSGISLNTQMLIISILMLGYNFYHVFFFDRFLRDYLIEYPSPGMNHFDLLVQKFQITKREKDIILLICEGKTNKEIAAELFISPVTVRDHLSRIFEKTNNKSRLQLANLFHGNLE